jgi:alkylation response protein AidB-like acyl-CoA dehydrogenase
MTLTTEPLALDIDPSRYLALHAAIDEPANDGLLDDRELQIRNRCREVVAQEVAPRAAEADRTHTFAHDSYQALVSAGLGGLIFPRRWGGTEDTIVAYAVAMEEISAGCAATSLIYMTQMHAGYPIWQAGSEELASRYIPKLIDGTSYGSLAVTEPDAGSDVSSLKTRATPSPGDDGSLIYSVSGSKIFITTGDRADVIVCFATVDPAAGRKGIIALVVDGSSAGLSRGKPVMKMGMHGSTTAELFFSGVKVPATHRLGEEGDGWRIVMASVVNSRISAAAQGVGIARAAYARTLELLQRIHGSRVPDDIAFTLAGLRGEILQGRLLLIATARQVDRRATATSGQIGMMKQACTDLGWRVSVAAAGLLGCYGDMAMFGVERCVRDSKVTQIYDGTNEVQRLLVGRDTSRRITEPT